MSDKTLEEKIKSSVDLIEMKPHVKFIRYLMTKRYMPRAIRGELQRLALSAPHESQTTSYYMYVIDPIVKKYNLGHIYADYKNRILQEGNATRFHKNILNYAVDIGGQKDEDLEVRFLKFLKELDVDLLWLKEIYPYYGTASKVPRDEEGNQIIALSSAKRNIEKVLLHPKRYLIDKFILEGISNDKIAAFLTQKMNMNINIYDISFYKKMVFDMKKMNTIEGKINSMVKEKECILSVIKEMKDPSKCEDLTTSDRIQIEKQSKERIEEIDKMVKELNSKYLDCTHQAIADESMDLAAVFDDMVARGYTRFCELDKYKDRDVVDPLYKISRMITTVYDKRATITSLSGKPGVDKHSQNVLIDLYKKRADEINAEEIKRSNEELKKIASELEDAGIDPYFDDDIDLSSVAGIEELGSNFDIDDVDDD